MLTAEDLFILEGIRAMGFALGEARLLRDGCWVIKAGHRCGAVVSSIGSSPSQAIWALHSAVVDLDLPVGL